MTPDPIYDGAHRRLEQDQSVGAAERQLARALWMWHQADDVPLLVAETGDIRDGAVGIGLIGWNTVGTGVAEDHLPVFLQAGDNLGGGVIVPLAMRDRHAKHLTLATG